MKQVLTIIGCIALSHATTAVAQTWPAKTVRMGDDVGAPAGARAHTGERVFSNTTPYYSLGSKRFKHG